MDKDNPLNQGAGLPPSESSYSMNSEVSGSSSLPPSAPSGTLESESGFSDFQMPENPRRILRHRRTHSMIFSDNLISDINDHKFPSETEEDPVSKYFNLGEYFLLSGSTTAFQVSELSSSAAASSLLPTPPTSKSAIPQKPPASKSSALPPKPPTSKSVATISDALSGLSEKPRRRHQRIKSMDGSTTIIESADTLAELSSSNLKLAKRLSNRILPNTLLATRSREKKMQYIADLERTLRILQTEAASLSAQLNSLQRDSDALTAENRELRLHLQDGIITIKSGIQIILIGFEDGNGDLEKTKSGDEAGSGFLTSLYNIKHNTASKVFDIYFMKLM